MKANDLYTSAKGLCLDGQHLFAISRDNVPASALGACRMHCGSVTINCTGGAHAQQTYAQQIARFREEGLYQRDLLGNFGVLSNLAGEVTHWISTNGQLWQLTYLGVDGGELAAAPFALASAPDSRTS
jgi:hypothetical protein